MLRLNYPFLSGLIILIILSGCSSEAPVGPAPTSVVVPTASPSPQPTATQRATEVAAELSEAEPAVESDEPPTPTATAPPKPDSATPTPVSEANFVIPGNPDLDYAQVIFVRAVQGSDGSWRFDTTVRHDDQSWDDYADAWQVVHPETKAVIAERILAHPHDNEQPFTRSQSNIIIPPDLPQVVVRAKDNVEGFGGQEIIVDLTGAESEYFEVIR